MQKLKGKKTGSPEDTSRGADAKPKLKRKEYEDELRKLHVELVKLQEWVRHKGQKVCILFEGRDGAGRAASSKP
jgi:polyphosphate kinase 2 (PPK2 family)